MNRLTLRLLPLLSLLFCLFLNNAIAKDTAGRKVDDQTPLKPLTSSQPEEERDQYTTYQDAGHDQFCEAAAILGKIKPPTTSKLAKFVRKPKGILGTAVYYAKEAFTLLFMNGPRQANILTTSTSQQATKLGPQLSKAVALLKDAANEGNRDAIYLLADMNFYGNYSHPINYDEAFDRYRRLADLDGNSTAQYMLGFLYSTGIAPNIPTNMAKSTLYHTFAAMQGNTRSEMTLAYRHHVGIATKRSCDEAVHWYKLVADKAVEYYRSGPPGGHQLNKDVYRIADEDGGVFGEGASVSSSGANARQGGPTSDAYADVGDVLEYLYLQSSKGDIKATFGLARLHYDGARGLKRDLRAAKKHFMMVAREYWTDNGKPKKDVSAITDKLATRAAGYLGRMFLRGEGTEQSYPKARIWFKRGVKNGDPLSQYSLGLMYLHGLGVEADAIKASEYFSSAADQDLSVAQTNLGMLFLDQGHTATAAEYFELAVRNGHIEAYYYLAEMSNFAVGRDHSCGVAAVYYKIAAEKAEAVWSSLGEASDAYDEGDTHKALISYLMAAEQGSENAQFNVAWLLDQSRPRWSPLTRLITPFISSFSSSFSSSSPISPSLNSSRLSTLNWARSALQMNVDSMVKLGDAYLSGLGLLRSSPEHAASVYQLAADTQQSAQAFWNLGWMHENGIGLPQDFHLAKRLYDQALATNKEAYLPVKLSLAKLRWRSWWNGVTRGGVHGIEDDDEGGKRRPRSFGEWLRDFIEADAVAYYQRQEEGGYEADDWEAENLPGSDGFWGGGGGGGGGNGGGGADEELDDGLMETLLIGGLVAALGYLVYYRHQMVRQAEVRRHEQQDQQQQQQQGGGEGGGGGLQPQDRAQMAAGEAREQQQQQQQRREDDRGVLPNPGEPEFNDWMAGAIGP